MKIMTGKLTFENDFYKLEKEIFDIISCLEKIAYSHLEKNALAIKLQEHEQLLR